MMKKLSWCDFDSGKTQNLKREHDKNLKMEHDKYQEKNLRTRLKSPNIKFVLLFSFLLVGKKLILTEFC